MCFSKYILMFFSITLLNITLYANEVEEHVNKKLYTKHKKSYEYNPHVSREVWERVKPYFLPPEHPVRHALDKIFSKSRVLQSPKSIADAGFPKNKPRAWSHTVVSTHPHLKGYYVKMFTDQQADIIDYEMWIIRIEGARAVQATLDRYGYNSMFEVPKKWIYPLPADPAPSKGSFRKNFILIAEDMDIYHKGKNNDKWRSKMNQKRADALYVILTENGLNDSIYPFNVPFCKNGKQAFIDTEHHHHWPVYLERMIPFFSEEMGKYWKELINKGGPAKK